MIFHGRETLLKLRVKIQKFGEHFGGAWGTLGF